MKTFLTEKTARIILAMAGYSEKNIVEMKKQTAQLCLKCKRKINRHKFKDYSKQNKKSLKSPFPIRRALIVKRTGLTYTYIEFATEKYLKKLNMVKYKKENKKIKNSPAYWYLKTNHKSSNIVLKAMLIYGLLGNFIQTPYYKFCRKKNKNYLYIKEDIK